MRVVGCGTPQGADRFQHRHGPDSSPHGDTHLRAVKHFEPEALIEGFDAATDRLLSIINSEASFRRPVTAAIDITTVPYYGDVEDMSMVSGTKDTEVRAFKFATLSNLGVNYLIPKRTNSTEWVVIETMDADGLGVAVESASVHVESGSHSMQFLYVPSTSGEGTTVFATNLRVGPEEAESFCRRYSRRWQIENGYKSIKGDFLAKTSSKDYRVRLFYFVFAVLLYNIWRLTDFLLKAGVDFEVDYAPVLTAGECVEMAVSELIPPD
jgi:hypothetical protein